METTAHLSPAGVMKEKVCLVTGATAGIGQVTATTLAAQGARVFIGARSKQKAEQVATDIWKTNFSFLGPVLKGIMKMIALTPEQGADNSIFLASSPDVSSVTGKYFVKREAVASSPLSYDETIAKRLWDVSANLTSLPPAINY